MEMAEQTGLSGSNHHHRRTSRTGISPTDETSHRRVLGLASTPPWLTGTVAPSLSPVRPSALPSVCSAARRSARASVAHILGELVPLSASRRRVTPRLTRVRLVAGANAVARAGKAVAAGLWPAIEELDFSHCRANASQFADLARGMSDGLVPRLRALNWDDQSCIRKRAVDDVLLEALARGRCPLVERLSFTGNHFCPEYRIDRLFDALRACPLLRELRMDCSRTPQSELRALTRALVAGHCPRLELLFVRATAPHCPADDVCLKALRSAAASRSPPVKLESSIKTRLED